MIIDITNGDAANVAYWKAERFIVKWTTSAASVTFGYADGGETHEVAEYIVADGAAIIDVTDFVRTYPERNMLLFAACNVLRAITFSIAGLINPSNVYIPNSAMLSAIGTGVICPPSFMFAPLGSYALYFENYGFENGDRRIVLMQGSTVVTQQDMSVRRIGIAGNIDRLSYGYYYSALPIVEKPITPLRCDCQYAMVRWVSFTGITRANTFEIVANKTTTKDAYELMDMLSEYHEAKGREDGCTLRLSGLCNYDLWYYADILHSSKVEVSFDGSTWMRARVNDKSLTLPDGEAGTDGVLQIAINYKKYDAINM